MNLRIEGSKIRRVRPGQGSPYEGASAQKKKSSLFPKRIAAPSVGFIYVVRSEHGLIKIGSTTKPAVALAKLSKDTPFRLEVEFLCFLRADCYIQVEKLALAAMEPHRVNASWFGCDPETAAAEILASAKNHDARAFTTSLVEMEESLRQAAGSMAATRPGQMLLLKKSHWKVTVAALIGVGAGLLALAARWASPNIHPLCSTGSCVLLGMALAFIVSRRQMTLPLL